MLVKVAYYASSIAVFWRNYAKIMLFFPNCAPLLKIMLFEKIANNSKKYIFQLEAVGLQERNATNRQ